MKDYSSEEYVYPLMTGVWWLHSTRAPGAGLRDASVWLVELLYPTILPVPLIDETSSSKNVWPVDFGEQSS